MRNLLQHPSQKATGGCAGTAASGCCTVKGLFVSRDRCPSHPQTKSACSPQARADGLQLWLPWLTAAASMTPRQTSKETSRQALGCAGVLAVGVPSQ